MGARDSVDPGRGMCSGHSDKAKESISAAVRVGVVGVDGKGCVQRCRYVGILTHRLAMCRYAADSEGPRDPRARTFRMYRGLVSYFYRC